MCILIFSPAGTTVPAHHLIRSCAANPDGFGYAIIGDDGLYADWSMDADTLIASWNEARAKWPNGHAMFHARIATHGTVDVGNCHPFWIGEHNAILGHNGMMPHVPTDGVRSDTRVFAEDWLPTLGISILDDEVQRKEIGKFIGYSKLVVLSVDDALQDDWYIINEHLGDWDKGVWYSNDSYLPYKPKWYGHGQGLWVPSTARTPLDDDILFDDERSFRTVDGEFIDLCTFCEIQYVVSPAEDCCCPDCGMCSVCQSWNCHTNGVHPKYTGHDEIIDEIDWANDDWYQLPGGEIMLWDYTINGWRQAQQDEYLSYDEWFAARHGVAK